MKFGIKKACVGLFSMLAIFCSCGEDRTDEFIEKTKDTHWLYDIMNEWYLWYSEMAPVSSYKDYFATPEKFFNKLLYKGDKYSYIEVLDKETGTRSIDAVSSYGIDFVLYVNPVTNSQSSTERFARVLYVLPESPAAEAGIRRGQWISGIGGEKLTSNNYTALINGPETTINISVLNYQNPDSLYWETPDTLQLAASYHLDDNPFFVDTVYHIEGKRIAYLMYNRFTTGPGDTPTETEYNAEMKQIFARFKQAAPTDFILDLRYNPGGYLSCAQVLASLLAPQRAFGQIFCSLEFNDKKSSENMSMLYEEGLTGGANLNLSRIYVITSESTASASESIINGLRPAMGNESIILVGTQTEGKNVASISFDKSAEYGLILHPIVARVYNGDGESDYANGFPPTYEIDELQFIDDYRPLGDTDEIMLNSTLAIIFGQVPSETRVTSPLRPTPLRPVYTSISEKTFKGMRIK